MLLCFAIVDTNARGNALRIPYGLYTMVRCSWQTSIRKPQCLVFNLSALPQTFLN